MQTPNDRKKKKGARAQQGNQRKVLGVGATRTSFQRKEKLSTPSTRGGEQKGRKPGEC